MAWCRTARSVTLQGVHEAGSERDAYLLKALALVTQHLPSGIAVLDATGHVMLVNEPCQRLLGLQATDARLWTEQVAGAQVRAAAGGRFIALAERPLARALAGDAVFGWKGQLRPPGGLQDVSVMVSAVPLRDLSGEVSGAVGIFSETNDQRRLESDLGSCLDEQRRLVARIAELDQQLAEMRARDTRVDSSPAVSLSPREHEILELVGQGRTNREIAAELGVSMRTVKAHLEHLFRKLGVTHRTQAATWAAERHPMPPE
jgi:DNA-binding CsgD family transcriptional regulator